MTENLCVRCGQPTPDGYADSRCAYRAGDQLHEIADMADAARDIAHGLSNHPGGSGSSGKPGSRLPLDLGATARLDAVEAVLTRWIDHIAVQRGTTRPWFTHTGDPIAVAAVWLAGHTEWIRHRPTTHVDDFGAERFLTDVDACARVIRGLARGPAEQKYLGPCGAPEWTENLGGESGCREIEGPPCEGDVYAYRGAKVGRCRTCGAEVTTTERQAWLDGEVRGHAFTARAIAEAHRVNVKTIRTWAARGLLKSYWRTDAGLVTPWVDIDIPDDLKGDARQAREAEINAELDARGPRLHYVGDVLDLAAADAGRRATEQAKRARRAATKAAESEDAP